MKEASYYDKLENNQVQCFLCPHHCKIKDHKRGVCGVRKKIDGMLYSKNYGKVTSLGFDPIEKKRSIIFIRAKTCFHKTNVFNEETKYSSTKIV